MDACTGACEHMVLAPQPHACPTSPVRRMRGLGHTGRAKLSVRCTVDGPVTYPPVPAWTWPSRMSCQISRHGSYSPSMYIRRCTATAGFGPCALGPNGDSEASTCLYIGPGRGTRWIHTRALGGRVQHAPAPTAVEVARRSPSGGPVPRESHCTCVSARLHSGASRRVRSLAPCRVPAYLGHQDRRACSGDPKSPVWCGARHRHSVLLFPSRCVGAAGVAEFFPSPPARRGEI